MEERESKSIKVTDTDYSTILPDDILATILLLCDVITIAKCTLVCRYWYNLIKNHLLMKNMWHKLHLTYYPKGTINL